MKIILIIAIILIPIAMSFAALRYPTITKVYSVFAYVSFVVFSIIASLTVYDVIATHKVFMTTVHKVFLNPYFILAGSYIGLYILYVLSSNMLSKNK